MVEGALTPPNGRKDKTFLPFLFLDIVSDFCYHLSMLIRTKKHTIYEVWSEDAAESVYVDHRPTKEEVNQLWDENWPNTLHKPKVFKEPRVYTQHPDQYLLERGED